ncbi:MAG: hypothetical protein IIC93_07690 [Chloroflexi bacterium]|nr:hypothetical protein [Chloroflexota bacterium]
MNPEQYNYASFPRDMQEADFSAFPNILHAGTDAPDGVLINAATGAETRLSDYWSTGPLVIEFGSGT